jgi:hypothetical protein
MLDLPFHMSISSFNKSSYRTCLHLQATLMSSIGVRTLVMVLIPMLDRLAYEGCLLCCAVLVCAAGFRVLTGWVVFNMYSVNTDGR